MTVLEASGLEVSYGTHPVFADVTLTLERGTVTALLGPNGCGKTTLLQCLCGLLRPRTGHIRVATTRSANGDSPLRDIWSLRAGTRAASIAFVPQDMGTSFGYSALQTVLMGRSAGLGMFGTPERRDERIARAELDRLGIGHLAERSITTMSGGERRLVLIARALVTRAPVLLLDEPTAHLDFRNQLLVHRILTELTTERGIAVAFSTHLPTDAFAAASHALLMNARDGHRFGAIQQVVTDETLRQAFSVQAKIVRVPVDGKPNHVVVPVRPV